jgi:hypothetical protein
MHADVVTCALVRSAITGLIGLMLDDGAALVAVPDGLDHFVTSGMVDRA